MPEMVQARDSVYGGQIGLEFHAPYFCGGVCIFLDIGGSGEDE